MKKAKRFVASNAPHRELRELWRSNNRAKRRIENWVDANTDFGSVPVFLRSSSDEAYQQAMDDLQIK